MLDIAENLGRRKLAYMRLYGDDLLRDCPHFNATEIGAYILILWAMFQNGAWLPDDDRALRQIGRCTPQQWREVGPRIRAMLKPCARGLTQKRLEAEFAKAIGASATHIHRASLGGRAKALKRLKVVLPPSTLQAEHQATTYYPRVQTSELEAARGVVDSGENSPASISAARGLPREGGDPPRPTPVPEVEPPVEVPKLPKIVQRNIETSSEALSKIRSIMAGIDKSTDNRKAGQP
jgi:uncharacterized protein YdaU (DUF1376 family)